MSTLYHGNTKMPAKKVGLAGIRTQVARFKVWSANHYTTKPFVECDSLMVIFLSFGLQTKYCFFFLRKKILFLYSTLPLKFPSVFLDLLPVATWQLNGESNICSFSFQFIFVKGSIAWVRSFCVLELLLGFTSYEVQ